MKYEIVDAQIEFVRSEIEIRIESIKIELDELYGSLNSQLDNCKQELFGYLFIFLIQFLFKVQKLHCLSSIADKIRTVEEQSAQLVNFESNEEIAETILQLNKAIQKLEATHLPVMFID